VVVDGGGVAAEGVVGVGVVGSDEWGDAAAAAVLGLRFLDCFMSSVSTVTRGDS